MGRFASTAQCFCTFCRGIEAERPESKRMPSPEILFCWKQQPKKFTLPHRSATLACHAIACQPNLAGTPYRGNVLYQMKFVRN